MFRKLNLALVIAPLMIFSLGFITLLSTSRELVRDQLVFFLIGLLFYFIATKIDVSVYKYFWKFLLVIAIVFLAITYFFAEFRSGSARWLSLGPLNFQTSEFAKIALVITVSSYLAQQGIEINKPIKLLFLGAITVPMLILVYLQPDLGTVVVMVTIFAGILFFSDLNLYYLLGSLLFVGIFSMPAWNMMQEYQKRRILVFLNPQLDVLGSGYNVIQSLIAVGSGGLTGKGFGRGTQANLQFLPAYWTDFIFASFAEEWGFVGVIVMLTLFLVLLAGILYIAVNAKDSFSKYLAIGIFFTFFTQFVINVGMNLGVMPVTGVTLPLVSYGGSSVFFSLISLGMLQNIWVNRRP